EELHHGTSSRWGMHAVHTIMQKSKAYLGEQGLSTEMRHLWCALLVVGLT
ncbi:hypothetical protein PanWU01x14_268970, partial [Parasponia andersonii]